MDQFITLLILFILIGLVDKFLKAARKAKPPVPPEAEREADEGTAVEGLPRALQDLIAEELGLDMERRPRVGPPARPAAPADAARTRVPSRPRRPREVQAQRPRESVPPEEAISLEELGMRERGAPVSLEAPRRPEERERLSDRYVGPERPRGPRWLHVRLPEPPGWSAAQKAIVWAELLGPPKGLAD
ncbi:MAG: hypothetical protein AMS25_12975 [Gemmatimonas sp. SM23_52]|nr:MAG: hypothetical protein AMS25_12975 [Gemmatimonas sp. SM23_52]